MTLEELRTSVLRELNENPVTPIYWTLGEIDAYLEEAQEILAETAGLVKRTFTIPRRPGTAIYQLPGIGDHDILAPCRVWVPDLKRRLQAVTLANLDARYERWMESPGEPYWWYPISWDQFGIWPAGGQGEGWMEVTCVCWPQPFLDAGDEPEFHPSRYESLATYATWLGYLKQWDGERAAQRLATFLGEAGGVRSLTGVQQVQEKWWARGRDHGNMRNTH